MTRTLEQAVAWARANPKYTVKSGVNKGQKTSWSGLCEAFMNNACGFEQSFDNALLAGNASGPLRKDWAAAPPGACHYWAGVGGDGHVALSLGGGQMLMASSRVSNFGTALGTIHFSNYGLPLYRGWSMRHGRETLAVTASAAASSSVTIPELPPIKKDTNMKLFVHRVGVNMAYYAASETQIIGPIVMGEGRLKGVIALYGPLVEVFDDGLDGIRDVINANVKQNREGGVFDLAVDYSANFKPSLSTVLHSMDSKIDGLKSESAPAAIDLDDLSKRIIAGLPATTVTAEGIVDAFKAQWAK